jgi:carbohydrate diacid regulator
MDHLKEYFRTLVPRQELQRVFHVCETMLDKSTAKQFSEMTAALEETNYNLTKAAQMLYVHKNTLVYRYNKMKDFLGIDPLESSQDRTFLELLHLYLEK